MLLRPHGQLWVSERPSDSPERRRNAAVGQAGSINSQGEHKTNMLAWLGYGAAARVSGKCDDKGVAGRIEAFALTSQSSRGPGQLPDIAGATPLAGRYTANATNDEGIPHVVEGPVEKAEIRSLRPLQSRIYEFELEASVKLD